MNEAGEAASRGIKICLSRDADQPSAAYAIEVWGVHPELLRTLQEPAMTGTDWRAILQVFVDLGGDASQPAPMLGSYRASGDHVRFTPRYPLLEGQRYGVRLAGSATEFLTIPRRAAPLSEVTHIYPSADVLPENLLRFYICFSAPMRVGESLRNIRLLDSEGQIIERAFLDPREELWDRTETRLTLLFDPGRVKTGLRAHEQLGRALVSGRSYRLVIDRAWRDARGEALASSAEKRFTAAPARLRPPEVSTWQLSIPPAESLAPLAIRLPESLDQGLLTELIHVCRADDSIVPGAIGTAQAETLWEFLPHNRWTPGRYRLRIDSRLEDPAGNNLHGLFDRPPSQDSESPSPAATLHFQVR